MRWAERKRKGGGEDGRDEDLGIYTRRRRRRRHLKTQRHTSKHGGKTVMW